MLINAAGVPSRRSSRRDAFATSGGVASGSPTSWPIAGRARPFSTFGLMARILVNSAALSSMPISRIFRLRALRLNVLIAYEMNGSALRQNTVSRSASLSRVFMELTVSNGLSE